jgi:hypothetical protein
MRRLIFLICAVVLLFDLADDGCLGKIKFVASHNTAKCSVASPNPTSGNSHFQVALAPENGRDLRQEFSAQPAAVAVTPSCKINHPYHFGSSGGLPL